MPTSKTGPPFEQREPACIHTRPGGPTQPMSACRECKDSDTLRTWREEWFAWLARNPDSWQARWLARWETERETRRQPQVS